MSTENALPEETMIPEPLLFTAFAVLAGVVALGGGGRQDSSDGCAAPGSWVNPTSGAVLGHVAAIDTLAKAGVVLLGENHDDADHHRWQLHTIAALHGHDPGLTLGFEALPRSAQPVLDAWVEGGLTEADFLVETQWDEVWGMDPQLYMPLFHFARVHKVPVNGLNVRRSLVRRVSREGWAAVPPAEREGLGEPAPASADYLDTLLGAFRLHQREGAPPPQVNDAGFRRFVEAQLVWDRAMAEAIADASRRSRVVAMVGRGHLEFGHGIPAQLRDLGIRNVAVALPWPAAEPCLPSKGTTAVADLLFTVASPPQTAHPR